MISGLRAFALIFSISLLFAVAGAQVIPDIPGGELMPLSEIKPGLKGTARTVFSGTKATEFNVEILGVLPNGVGPGEDMIVGKLSGGGADRTQVFAGMSGSPVYINGKLVGAVSYSFPYSKEPICGITPIEQMISAVAQGGEGLRAGGTATFAMADLMGTNWRAIASPLAYNYGPRTASVSVAAGLGAVSGQSFMPIATPLMFGGVSKATLDAFSSDLAATGMQAVASTGGSSSMEFKKPDRFTLVGGNSVTAALARGDLSVSAAGTVTWRDGEKVYAFGHTYFGLGAAELPLSESHVITVVPSLNNSFKIAVPDATVGTLTQDRSTGIFGFLGREPKMIPVDLHIITSRGRDEYVKFDSAIDDFLTPLIVNVGLLNAMQGNERTVGDNTVDVTGEIKIAGHKSIILDRRYSGPQATPFAASAPAVPLAALLKTDLAELTVTGIDVTVKVSDRSVNSTIDRLSVDRSQVRPGETVDLGVSLRSEGGKVVTTYVPVKIPLSAQPGQLMITVADGSAVQTASAAQSFSPRSIDELIDTLNNLRRSDKLYAVLTRNAAGTIIGGNEMPNLPPSMLASINSDRAAGGAKATTTAPIAEYLLDLGNSVVSGSQAVTIEVVR